VSTSSQQRTTHRRTFLPAAVLAAAVTVGACDRPLRPLPDVSPSAGDDCIVGRFTVADVDVTALAGLDPGRSRINVTGGSLQLEIRHGGRWRLEDDATDPLVVEAGPLTGRLVADGYVEGRSTRDGNRRTFTHTRSSGTATLSGWLIGSTPIPLEDVSTSFVPDGAAIVSCDGDLLTLRSVDGDLSVVLLRDEAGDEASDDAADDAGDQGGG
jgi:hypothetical protein